MKKHLPKNKATVLCLRTVKTDHTAYNGFKWPKSGYVEAPDFTTEAECGNGLHGYLRGAGDAESILWDGIFQVVKVVASEVIQLDGKVKFPRCEVVFSGDQKQATDMLVEQYPGVAVIGAIRCGGNKEIVSVGCRGFATAGNRGIATAGNRGTATAGDDGTATAGYNGTATAGHNGTATAGDNGTATAGDDGTATAGYNGTATAGENGIISIRYWDGNRYREIIGYIGEDGLLPNVPYKLNTNGKFVKAKPDPIPEPVDPCDGKIITTEDGKKYKLTAI